MNNEKQGWELLASPGHVLLAQVAAVQGKAKLGYALVAAGAVALVLGAVGGQTVEGLLRKASAWAFSSSTPVSVVLATGQSTPAPLIVRELGAVPVNIAPEVVGSLSTEEDSLAWVQASIKRLNAGQEPEFCVYGPKIIDSLLQGDGTQPSCRKGAEGRVWTWAVMRRGDSLVLPFGGVFRKSSAGYQFYRLRGVDGAFRGYPQIDAQSIPRAMAADLPELAN